MKRTIFITILFSLQTALFSQQFIDPASLFSTIFEKGKEVNSYYVGYNPAYLPYDNTDKWLHIQSLFDDNSGEFKQFIEPSIKRTYQLSFSGKKAIGETQIFKGRFAFQRIEHHDWKWLSTRNYSTGNPFLLGDSTSGRSRFNGILMNAEYSNKLWDKLLFGIQFHYGVDEGMKEVSPRPTSIHRDINIRIGAGYLITENLTFGVVGNFYDFNERISYREDEGALLQETVLLKFRGYDFPFVIRKKVETRYSFHNGYRGYATASLSLDNFNAAAYIGSGVEQLVLKEDVSNPLTVGLWQNKMIDAGLRASVKIDENFFVGAKYKYTQSDMWAKHPQFQVLYMEGKSPDHSFTLGAEYRLSQALKFGIEGGIDLVDISKDDYYSSVFWKTKGKLISGAAGSEFRFSDIISASVAYGVSTFTVDETSLLYGTPSTYFNDFRIMDILFFQSSFLKHTFNAKIDISPGFDGIISILINYNLINSDDSLFTEKLKRNKLNIVLEYKVDVF